MTTTSFGTVLTCVDGRIQRPVADFLVTRFGVPYLDTVTRPGMIKHLTSSYDPATNAILTDLNTSLGLHGSTQIALVAHHDCVGNPVDDDTQRSQLQNSVDHFVRRYPGLIITGLWVGEKWTVEVFV
ncbi:MAG TPA: carbonic anhydrase [Acidimicrobiia bacterium]